LRGEEIAVGFQENGTAIRWRVHLESPPDRVHRMLATGEGRRRFWAEEAEEKDGHIEFRFLDGSMLRGRILENAPPARFAVEYFGGSTARFELRGDGRGGTDLTLRETGIPEGCRLQNLPGWVSVLLALKAAVDFSVDLRNGDRERGWDRDFVDV
jgi:uncharacterized protein YndB with AHSA1/START domain